MMSCVRFLWPSALAATSVTFSLVSFAAPPVSITTATISATIPTEIVDGDMPPKVLPVAVSALPLDFFDDFSWRSFVALNWPAKAGVRGVADTTKQIGETGTRVWETWKAGYEIVPANANTNPPKPWEEYGPTPCGAGAEGTRVLGTFRSFGDLNQAGFDAVGNPLICQNKTYSRYEVRVNQAEYDFIVAKKLYLRSSLIAVAGAAAPLRFTNGAIEVKAAWREFTAADTEAVRSRFYRLHASVLHPTTGMCETKEMGLVGLHIVQKTPLRPQWIWSSFEHVDNIAGATRSYNDPMGPQVSTDPAVNKAEPTLTASTFSTNPNPTQVVRVLPLHGPVPAQGVIGTAATNARYQAKLAGTVWANYQLVVTQWPTETTDTAETPPDDILGNPFPEATDSTTSVANITMETFEQEFTSCMHCHDAAREKKTDFVFFVHFHAFNDVLTPGSARPLVLDALNATKANAQRSLMQKK